MNSPMLQNLFQRLRPLYQRERPGNLSRNPRVGFARPEDIPTMTTQDVFDRCAVHMMRQGKPAQASDGSCWYRLGVYACGVGVVIPDAWYDSAMENRCVRSIAIGICTGSIRAPLELAAFLERHQPLLEQIQWLHDHVPVEDWRMHLEQLAGYFGLHWRCLAQFDLIARPAYSPAERVDGTKPGARTIAELDHHQ